MEEEFENWLKGFEDKTKNVAYQYKMSIHRISRHYSQHNGETVDLYINNDIDFINRLVNYYGLYGKYNEFGEIGHGTNRASINAYARFLEFKKSGKKYIHKEDLTQEVTKKRKYKAKIFKRTNPGDVANLYIRNFLCDISEKLGGFTEKNEIDTLKYFNYRCPYTDIDLRNINYIHDHLIPHNRQNCGLYIFGNVILTTSEANSRKHAKDYRSFILHDTKIIQGNINEREARIKKIDDFVEYSGYNKKINIITILQNICDEKYKYILELCDENKYEIDNIIKTLKKGHGT